MAEHTPGPWKATRSNWLNEPVEHEFYIHGNERKSRSGNYATGVAIVCGNKTSHGVTDANAHLIAAAPALLAACRLALGRLQNPLLSTSLFDDVKRELRKVILEAEGTPDA